MASGSGDVTFPATDADGVGDFVSNRPIENYLTVSEASHDNDAHRREIARGANRALDGKVNALGRITLAAGKNSTTVIDPRATVQSHLSFMPLTATAAQEKASGAMYVKQRKTGEFTVGHSIGSATDRAFGYLVLG